MDIIRESAIINLEHRNNHIRISDMENYIFPDDGTIKIKHQYYLDGEYWNKEKRVQGGFFEIKYVLSSFSKSSSDRLIANVKEVRLEIKSKPLRGLSFHVSTEGHYHQTYREYMKTPIQLYKDVRPGGMVKIDIYYENAKLKFYPSGVNYRKAMEGFKEFFLNGQKLWR